MIEEHFFSDRAEMIASLADEIEDFVFAEVDPDAPDTSGRPLILFSGGSTPKPLFEELNGREPSPIALASVGLVDERCVAPDHPDSNLGLLNEHLMAGLGQALPMYDPADPATALAAYTQALSQGPGLAVLGMGGDAHTASIFPNLETTAALLDPANPKDFALNQPVDAPHQRLTWTLAGLAKLDRWYLHIEGVAKRAVYEAAKGADPIAAPIAAFINHPSKTLYVYWCP